MRRDIRLKKLRKKYSEDIAREADALSIRQVASARFSVACDRTAYRRDKLRSALMERNRAYRDCWLTHEANDDMIALLQAQFRSEGDTMSLQEKKDCAAELSRLQAEIQRATRRYEQMEEVLQNTQQGYDKAVHAMQKKEHFFQIAKNAHYRTQHRTELSKSAQQRALDEVFDEAGVPVQYRFKATLRYKEGYLNLFFGDPKDHGHYVISEPGKVTYGRNPGEPRGAHNFRT